MSMDFGEVEALRASLGTAPRKVIPKVRASVVKGAVSIKNQMITEAKGSTHFSGTKRPSLPASIDFDMTDGGMFGSTVFQAEIGPNKSRHTAAGLAGIAYFGGARGGGGTVPDPRGALEAEAPKFVEAVATLAGFIFDD